MANRVVGIDFGQGVIRGAEVEEPGTPRSRVSRFGAVPVPAEAIVSGEVRDPQEVASALRQLWSKAGFRTKRVVLGIGNSRVLARDLAVPARPLAQIREGLRFQVADMLPMPAENAVLDYYPVMHGTDEQGAPVFHGLLIAALKDVVLGNERAAHVAGLEVVAVDMIPFALIRMLSDQSTAETSAFVDVGATTTVIAVATGGIPEFVRIVPMGGEDATRSLMELGQLSREQAEQIKRTIGLLTEGVDPKYRPVVELMVARSSELMASIRDTLAYFADTRQRQVARILLTGGGARVGGLAQMVQGWTRIPASIDATLEDPDFTVATALALSSGGPSAGRRAEAFSAPRVAAPVAAARTSPEEPGPFTAPPGEGLAPLAEAAPGDPPVAEPVPAAAPGGSRSKKEKKEKKDSIWTRPLGGRK